VDTGFLVLVAVSLCFLSGLIAQRMHAGGRPAREIAVLVVELWVAFGLWIAIFRSLAARIGAPAGEGALGELDQLGRRIASLPAPDRWMMLGGTVLGAAILVHLLWSLSRAMRGDAGG
jgi:hypothetical protein